MEAQHTNVVCWLMGSAVGHEDRWQTLLEYSTLMEWPLCAQTIARLLNARLRYQVQASASYLQFSK